jgi:hypothetical protein
MPQISLYIDEATLKKVEQQAKMEHISISKWVAEQIKNKIDPRYPADFETLYGSLSDDFIRQDQLPYSIDAIREQL